MHCIDSANASARTLLQTSGDMPDGGALDLATVPRRRETPAPLSAPASPQLFRSRFGDGRQRYLTRFAETTTLHIGATIQAATAVPNRSALRWTPDY